MEDSVKDDVVLKRLMALEIACLRGEARDAASVEAYVGNPRIKRAVERSLQVAVEICLDIGRRIIALEGLRYPADKQDSFAFLSRRTSYLTACCRRF